MQPLSLGARWPRRGLFSVWFCFPVLLPLLVCLYKHCAWGDRVVEMNRKATQMG